VRARQQLPSESVEIRADIARIRLVATSGREDSPRGLTGDAGRLLLAPRVIERARERARRSRRPHNQARTIFAREIINALTRQLAARIGTDVRTGELLIGTDDATDLRHELRSDPAVRSAIAELWPFLTPQQLVGELLADPDRLAVAAPRLSAEHRAALLRDPGAAWTPADVPLLDEAAELLGEDTRASQAAAARQRRRAEAYAQGVLDIIGRDEEADEEILMGADLVDASRLATRFEAEEARTAAERAAADRTWAFGHVIVDEAQELSPMAWRMLMRRVPARSLTIVGDVAQTGHLAGSTSWHDALDAYLPDRWLLFPLTVNYRTPAEVMVIAADVLAEIDPAAQPPRSVRESGHLPWQLQAAPGELATAVAQAAAGLSEQAGDGKLAVIVPEDLATELAPVVAAAVPGTAIGADPDLTSPVVVLTVQQAKGLEFDCVLIVEPERLLAASPRGLNDLYVALTRATQQVGVVYAGELPAVLGRLAPAPSPAGVG
jgi:DNA helicase IV